MSRKVMSPKEHSNEKKADSTKKPLRLDSKNFDRPTQQINLNSIIQRAKKDPRSLSPREVLELQRVLGNRAVIHLLQADLTIGQPGDQYEQEADRVADQVASRTELIQTQAAPEEEEEVQAKAILERIAKGDTSFAAFSALSRTLVDEEGKLTDKVRLESERSFRTNNASALSVSKLDGGSVQEQIVSPLIAQRIEQGKGQGNLLPTNVQRTMTEHLGYDFSDVRVKTDNEAADLSRQLGARAFTQGRDIWLGQGESVNDSRLIAHELTHVVQQGAAPRIERKKESNRDRVSDVVSHLRGMMRGEKEDTQIYRDVVTQFNKENPKDRLAFLQRKILGSTSDISTGAKPNSIRLGLCGGGGGGAGGGGGEATVAAPPTFPTSSEISEDATVETARAADWAAGEGDYAERFAWITWNADTHAYAVVGKATGTWEGVTPGPKPADAAPTYHVGEYHQHPPLPPAEAPETANYPVGPSEADETTSNADNSPGLVRDYTDTTRTTVCDYTYGPTRRA